MALPFDLNRYGDILVNVMLVILCFFLTSVNLWWIFFWFLISMLFIYAWDDYRFLRQCSETHFNTQRMEITGQYLTAFPCALLAAAVVFKLYGGQALEEEAWEDYKYLLKHTVWVTALAAFWIHLLLHCLFLRYAVPLLVPHISEREDNDTPYETAASVIACSWFNANAVHCLRSRYVYNHSPPFVHYEVGKYYLQRRNPAIKAYYEAEDYEKEASFLQDMKALEAHSAASVKSGAMAAKKGVKRAGHYVWDHARRIRSSRSQEPSPSTEPSMTSKSQPAA